MKFHHTLAAAATMLALGAAQAAPLPGLSTYLGLDPDAALVGGGAASGGSGLATFTFDLSTLSSVSGTLASLIGSVTITSIGVSGPSIVAPTIPDANGFYMLSGLSAGSYSITFTATTPDFVGAYLGTLTATATPVPEAESLILALAGLSVLGFLGRRHIL